MGTSQPTVIPNPCVVTVIRAPASTPALGQATTLGVPTSATSSMEDTADLSNTFQQVHTCYISSLGCSLILHNFKPNASVTLPKIQSILQYTLDLNAPTLCRNCEL